MEIPLGKYETRDGKVVDAWIEPNFPAYRSGAIRDSGFLCVKECDADPSESTSINLRLESMSEEAWKLTDTVGVELGRILWEERRKYDRSPYYMVHDHAQFGRVYFAPWVAIDSEPSVAFQTRPDDGRYSQEGTVIPENKAHDQLRALFAHESLQTHGGLIPDSHQIDKAIEYAQRLADTVISARAEYSATVDWDFDQRLTTLMAAGTGRKVLTDPDDIDRYESLCSWANRPSVHDFVSDEPEFYRWFEYGGKKRLEPLTSEQLTEYLLNRGSSEEYAQEAGRREAIPSAEWAWFKEQRLGLMREPVETLHSLILNEEQQQTPNREWLEKATKAGDFCGSMPVGPAKVHAAIQEYVVTRQRDYVLANANGDQEAIQRELRTLATDPVYRSAVAALTMLQDPSNGLAIEQSHPVSKVLGVYDDLHENNLAKIAALDEGDKVKAALHAERGEALLTEYHRAELATDQPQGMPPEVESNYETGMEY